MIRVRQIQWHTTTRDNLVSAMSSSKHFFIPFSTSLFLQGILPFVFFFPTDDCIWQSTQCGNAVFAAIIFQLDFRTTVYKCYSNSDDDYDLI